MLGGTANFDMASSSTANLTVNGGVQGGSGLLDVTGALIWSAGFLSGTGTTTVNAAGTLTIDGTASKFLDARTLRNSGAATWVPSGTGIVYFQNGGNFLNAAGATFTLQGDANFSNNGNPGAFTNNGSLLRTVSSGQHTFNVQLVNTGTVDVQTGFLHIAAGSDWTGVATIALGASLRHGTGTHILRSGFGTSGAGTFVLGPGLDSVVTGATVTMERLFLSGAVLTGPGMVVIGEVLHWSAGTMRGSGSTQVPVTDTLTIDGPAPKFLDGRTLQIAGVTSWLPGGSGILYLQSGGNIQNLAGAQFEIEANSQLGDNGAPGPFNNAGTLVRFTGTGTHTISVPFTNTSTGTVAVQSGVLNFSAGGNWSASATMQAAGELRLSAGTHVFNNGFITAGPGMLGLTGGIDSVATAGATVHFERASMTGAVLTGPGTFVFDNALTWTAGTMRGTGTTQIAAPATLTIDQASSKFIVTRTLQNAGTATWLPTGTGILYFQSGGAIQNSGTFELRADGTSIGDNSSPGPLTNSGTLRRTTGTGTMTIDVPVVNVDGGIISIESGPLAITKALDHQDDAIIQGVGTLSIMGSVSTLAGDLSPGLTSTAATLSINSATTITLGPSSAIVSDVYVGGTWDEVDFNAAVVLNGHLEVDGTFSAFPIAVIPVRYDSQTGTFTSMNSLLTSSAIQAPAYNPTNFSATIVAFP